MIDFNDGAFIGYAHKCDEIEQIINRILKGETNFEVSDDIMDADLRYIEKEVQKRL